MKNFFKEKFDKLKKNDLVDYMKSFGDLRQEYPPNSDDSTHMSGQVIAFFDSGDDSEREVVGSATLCFILTSRKYVIITAAHNLAKFDG